MADLDPEVVEGLRKWISNYQHANKPPIVAEVEDLLASWERRGEALKPFAAFADAWDRKPIRGIDDEVYSIHSDEDRGVLRLSDCKRARAALDGQP